ncbi:Hypothetical protein DEACI_1202 [Acididesulfobacillus acetoxydans]|uniref:Uncharacterized protein n=1 Tax=Acididesulfobacillus acetoxydans TaxID=1561005 RepID=A0A8S0W7B6_9FIRM|nr:Hypothetical protein DEACI_1202 [Acididesulfobacillus acetoxydans]CEJ06683.1 Hypothetical protein DEACI_1132 [Acididesulfobacillus acetoxydans]
MRAGVRGAEGKRSGRRRERPEKRGNMFGSELVQLKLNIETSVTKVSSGEFRRSRLSQNYASRRRRHCPVDNDGRRLSLPPPKQRVTAPTCRSGSLTVG